jgi:hypothetical protein
MSGGGSQAIAPSLARRLRRIERDDPLGDLHTARGACPAGATALGRVVVAFFAELVVLALLDPLLSQDPAALPTGFVITFFVLNVMASP